MRENEYEIVYWHESGTRIRDLGFLEDGETEPDITKHTIPESVWCMQIGFSKPLEHELVLAPNVVPNVYAERWPFYATYYPNATLVSYSYLCRELRARGHSATREVEKQVAEVLAYGVNYADYDVNVYGKPTMPREEMFFIQARNNSHAVLCENAAILTPVRENDLGVLWRKHSPFLMRYKLA